MSAETKHSGPVDVLARIEACWGKDSLEYRAVAELIEAVCDFRDCETVVKWGALKPARRQELIARYKPPQGTRPLHEARARWEAALASVGGAS